MRLLLPLALVALFVGCAEPETADAPAGASTTPVEYTAYGDPIPADQPGLAAEALLADAARYAGQTVRVEGEIEKVCRMKGCWLTLRGAGDTDAGADERIRVEVPRDSAGQYVYTFPTDLAQGQAAVVEGTIQLDTTSVDVLRHFAEDEGRPAEEIEAITEPRLTVVLTAHGARVAARPDAEAAAPAPATEAAPAAPTQS